MVIGVDESMVRERPDGDDSKSLSLLFRALAHPARRRILEMASTGQLTLMSVADQFSISTQATEKHLRIMETSGLLRSTKSGRTRTYTLNPVALDLTARWLRVHQGTPPSPSARQQREAR